VRKIKLLLFGVVLAALLAVPGAAMAKSHDRDHDKMPDKWEKKHGLSTHRKNAKADPDKDGLVNIGEFRSHTDPKDADSDNDGTEDGDEDGDRDGVDDQNETEEHTSPTDRDTDNDGVRDGSEDRDRDGLDNRGEDRTANDPTDKDTDNDGVKDGDEDGGTIVSFTADSANPGSGVLTIKLADDSTVTGKVDGTTRIECKTEDEQEDGFDDHGGDRNSRLARGGADDGPGHDAGDDNPTAGSGSGGADDGPGHDAGDDNGGDNSGPGSTSEHDGDEDNVCTTADLTPGTAVHEAELNGTGADAVFEKVEIVK
jgi:hypothetical protein